ncbi:MAG: hypothetical protein U0974_08875 [Gemmatimonadales bacterium]|nr:hypothetical protein [Gemmatimonadales bacterium]MDZ4389829.1 hypothetical protein [Gemmatimonadales bacterium]
MKIHPFRTPFPTSRLLGLAALSLALGACSVADRPAESAGGTGAPAEQAPWLAQLDGSHRMLFDAASPGDGIPLIHAKNYYDTFNRAYQVDDAEVDAVLTFYGGTTFYGLNDSMWSKYQLGAFTGAKDASGTPFSSNPWRTAPNVLGSAMPEASVESLQQRGATFILCDNALGFMAGQVAAAGGLERDAVYEEMKANILPGVTLVPAMVIAIDQAQQAGVSYHRQ